MKNKFYKLILSQQEVNEQIKERKNRGIREIESIETWFDNLYVIQANLLSLLTGNPHSTRKLKGA